MKILRLRRLLLLTGVLLSFLFCLFGTRPGLWLLQKSVIWLSGSSITIDKTSGTVLGGFLLEDIKVQLTGEEIQFAKIHWDWQPSRLLQGEFHLIDFELTGVKIKPIKSSDTGGGSGSGLPQMSKFYLPLTLTLERVAINKLQFLDSKGSEIIAFDSILLQMQAEGRRISLDNFSVDSQELAFALHGTLDFDTKWLVDLLGDWRVVNYGFYETLGTFSAKGPLDAPHAAVGIHSPVDIRVEGDVANLLEKPEWKATLDGRNLDLEAFIKHCPKIEVETVHGDLTGGTGGYGGTVEAVATWGTLDKMQVQTTIDAGLMGIDFTTLRVSRGEGLAVGDNARIHWKRLFDWDGIFHFHNFDPSHFFAWLPGLIDADITNVGTVRDDLGVNVSFDIHHLEGELRGQPVSAVGKLALNENDIRTEGVVVQSGDFAGNARIKNGMISWVDRPKWMVDVQFDHFNPAALFPDFPGDINGSVAGEGLFGPGSGTGFVKINNVQGQLRGNVLEGYGEIRLDNEVITTSGLFLRSGDSKLKVDGHAGDAFALDVSLVSPDVSRLWPEAGGNINLSGKLRGSYDQPSVKLDLRGQKLRLHGDKIERIESGVVWQKGHDGPLQGTLHGTGINYGGFVLDNLALEIAGTNSKQQIKGQVKGDFGTGKIEVETGYDGAWLGLLKELQLSSPDYGQWRLQNQTSFSIVGGGAVIDTFCLARHSSTACMDGSFRFPDTGVEWQLRNTFKAVPLDILNTFDLVPIPISGAVDGEIDVSGNSFRLNAGKVELRAPSLDLQLDVEDEEFSVLHSEDTVLRLQADPDTAQLQFSTKMPKGSHLSFSGNILEKDMFSVPYGEWSIAGGLDLRDFDVSILSAFTGFAVVPSGRVSSTFSLHGTFGQPELVGEAVIEDGGIALPYQGINLENVKVAVTADEVGGKISCQATSGGGQASADGSINWGNEGIEGGLKITGKNFLAFDLPEYVIRVDPDIKLQFSGKTGAITGLVQVPAGSITPEEIKDSVKVSQDVVLAHQPTEKKTSGIPFSIDLGVALGDDVHFKGYGLNGRLKGELNVKTSPEEFPTAKGELSLLDSIYSIYGRTLDIERGRIIFTGGPIDNPGVDIRAQKKFSEAEAKNKAYTVGVDISGFIQDLQYRLFSDPYMDDTEILSQMIVGHSLAFASKEEGSLLGTAATTLGLKGGADLVEGIGNILQIDDMHIEGSSKNENVSLVVGKRLTKDLYIGYDMNMFSQVGQFRVRYDLKGGFAVETKSSSQSTGADLLYSFEK